MRKTVRMNEKRDLKIEIELLQEWNEWMKKDGEWNEDRNNRMIAKNERRRRRRWR